MEAPLQPYKWNHRKLSLWYRRVGTPYLGIQMLGSPESIWQVVGVGPRPWTSDIHIPLRKECDFSRCKSRFSRVSAALQPRFSHFRVKRDNFEIIFDHFS